MDLTNGAVSARPCLLYTAYSFLCQQASRGHEPEQFAYGSVICVGALDDRENHISNTNNSQITGKCVKRQTVALFQELEVLLANRKKDFNAPPNTGVVNDLLFANLHIHRDQSHPVLALGIEKPLLSAYDVLR